MRSIDSRVRSVIALLPLLFLISTLVPSSDGGALLGGAAWAQNPAPAPAPANPPKVDVTVTTEREVWYLQPIWIAVGACVLILLVALIVAGSRGGSTTVVK
jgi:hypothetical protein